MRADNNIVATSTGDTVTVTARCTQYVSSTCFKITPTRPTPRAPQKQARQRESLSLGRREPIAYRKERTGEEAVVRRVKRGVDSEQMEE